MSTLATIDLSSYGCNVYVETGTGKALSLGKAIPLFEKCFSVDLEQEFLAEANQKYPSSILYRGLSTEGLEHWLTSGEINESDNVLFFLDAHFPGSDFFGVPYSMDDPNAVPLKQELELIKKYRPNGNDYIICDDLRIFMKGPFDYGDTTFHVPGGLDFLYEIYDESKITLDYRETGYIFIDNRK